MLLLPRYFTANTFIIPTVIACGNLMIDYNVQNGYDPTIYIYEKFIRLIISIYRFSLFSACVNKSHSIQTLIAQSR